MKYEYVVAYRVTGIEHKVPSDLELLVGENGQLHAVLTKTPDKFDGYINDRITVWPSLVKWFESQSNVWWAEQFRNDTTSRPKCEDAPHIVIQIMGERGDLDGKEIVEADSFVIHLNPTDPSDSIRAESEDTIAAILVSLILETGGTLTLDKMWDSVVMVRGDGKRTIPFNCSQIAEITDCDSLANDSPTKITDRYRRLSSGKEGLGTVLRLLKLSLETEKDKLRSFLFGWSAAEIFVNQVFTKYEKNMFVELGGDSQSELRYALMERNSRCDEGQVSTCR